MVHNTTRVVLLTTLVLLGFSLQASPIADFSALDRSFGSGTSQIAFVVDWNDGTPDDTLTWGLSYNPGDYANVYEAMTGLAAADPSLSFSFTDFGFGQFLDGIEVTGADAHRQDRNDYPNPWDQTFSVWEGMASGDNWTSNVSGISATAVTDGYAYGLSWNPNASVDFIGTPPNAPAVIPEPATGLFLLFGAAVLSWVRRVAS